MMTAPKISPRFQKLIPPLEPAELLRLEANILADGCRDPLALWKGTLLDGHNRLAICQQHNLPFQTVELELADEDAAVMWIILNQLGRRNIKPFTRATLALELEPILRRQAKERQVMGGKDKVPQKSAEAKESREAVAKAAGVSHDTIAKVKIILARASEETKAALRTGETSINAEYKKLTVHVGQNSGEFEWYTPPEFVEAARQAMGSIDCDPASSAVANETVKAEQFFDQEQDGLVKQWRGNVFLNPPYAQPTVSLFAEAVSAKFESGEIKQACVLVNNATETTWFARMANVATALCFPLTRIRFVNPTGQSGAPLQGQSVLYIGKHHDRFCKAFSGLGLVCHVIRAAT